MKKQKIDYLIRSIINAGQEKKCPFCGGQNFKRLDRKYLFTSLLQCNNCKLNHRHPKDNEKWLKQFYQKKYHLDTHIFTVLPPDDEIQKLKENNFPSQRSYSDYIEALFKGEKNLGIIDYGCSWGYDTFRLIKAGHKATGYEVSIPRGDFGKTKLGVPIFSELNELPLENDVILSSHVIEHLSNIGDFISTSQKLLKREGVFMAFCPNGSEAYAKREPNIWHVNWGAVHPNYISVEFAQYAFRKNPYLILTDDWAFNTTQIRNWDGLSQVTGSNQAGKELLIISKPNIEI